MGILAEDREVSVGKDAIQLRGLPCRAGSITFVAEFLQGHPLHRLLRRSDHRRRCWRSGLGSDDPREQWGDHLKGANLAGVMAGRLDRGKGWLAPVSWVLHAVRSHADVSMMLGICSNASPMATREAQAGERPF